MFIEIKFLENFRSFPPERTLLHLNHVKLFDPACRMQSELKRWKGIVKIQTMPNPNKEQAEICEWPTESKPFCEKRQHILLTECFKWKNGEEDEQNRNQILQRDYRQVTTHTCNLQKTTNKPFLVGMRKLLVYNFETVMEDRNI